MQDPSSSQCNGGHKIQKDLEDRSQVLFDTPENDKMKIYEMDVYILSERLSDLIWNNYERWPEKVKQSMGNSIILAADSITAYLAKGYGRYVVSERKLYYRYARGAFEETKAWLRKLTRRKIIKENEIPAYEKIIDELGPKLNSFIKKTK